jgi:hypothetical protein
MSLYIVMYEDRGHLKEIVTLLEAGLSLERVHTAGSGTSPSF